MDQLTDRELEVLAGMAQGLTAEQAGKKMFLALDTVKSHRVSLFRKIGALNAAHAVALGYQRGLLHLEPVEPAAEPAPVEPEVVPLPHTMGLRYAELRLALHAALALLKMAEHSPARSAELREEALKILDGVDDGVRIPPLRHGARTKDDVNQAHRRWLRARKFADQIEEIEIPDVAITDLTQAGELKA